MKLVARLTLLEFIKVPTSAETETKNELGSTFQSYIFSRNLLEEQLFAAVHVHT